MAPQHYLPLKKNRMGQRFVPLWDRFWPQAVDGGHPHSEPVAISPFESSSTIAPTTPD